ncbi:MAG: hypothetical protein WA086_11130, partial [Ideonella sp.]
MPSSIVRLLISFTLVCASLAAVAQPSGTSVAQPAAVGAATSPSVPAPAHLPLPVLPGEAGAGGKPVVFGSQIFSGRFSALNYTGFNPDYQIAVG